MPPTSKPAVTVPSGLTVEVPPKLFATDAAVLYSWLPVIASVLPAATVPSLRPLILLVAPSVTTLPTVVLSAVTEVKLTSSLVAMVMVLPACVTAMFLPASTVTVSPGLTCSTVVPLAVPAEALVVRSKPRVAAAPAALMASETLV